MAKAKHRDVLEAGGVVVRRRDGEWQFLIVTAKRDPNAWVLPKGHIEDDESEADTAQREVREEAGVAAKVIAPLGAAVFPMGDKTRRVEFFLMTFDHKVVSTEDRRVRWLDYDSARAKLSYREARKILAQAQAYLDRTPPTR